MLILKIDILFGFPWKQTLREGFVCSDFFFSSKGSLLRRNKKWCMTGKEPERMWFPVRLQPQADPVRRLWSIKYTHLRVCPHQKEGSWLLHYMTQTDGHRGQGER